MKTRTNYSIRSTLVDYCRIRFSYDHSPPILSDDAGLGAP